MDHHCHPLRRWPSRIEAKDLRACFTPSQDERVLADHIPNTALYRLVLRRLAPIFGCRPTEAAILTARDMLEPARYARELLVRSRTGMMLVDAGYDGPDAMTFEEHRAAVPLLQHQIVRVENLAEELVERNRRPEDWLNEVRAELERAVSGGAVAVKTVLAARASLRLSWPDPRDVRAAYADLRQSLRGAGQERPRLTGNPLCHALVLAAAEECVRLDVPLQVRCGIGAMGADLGEGSPTGLRPLLTHRRFADLKLVLLHCYPYHREAAYLCSVHPGVFMDLSLAIPLALTDGARALREALGLCPWTKLLYATDASRLPEMFLIAAQLYREALADALGDLVERQLLSHEEARDAGRQILAGNARRLYRV